MKMRPKMKDELEKVAVQISSLKDRVDECTHEFKEELAPMLDKLDHD